MGRLLCALRDVFAPLPSAPPAGGGCRVCTSGSSPCLSGISCFPYNTPLRSSSGVGVTGTPRPPERDVTKRPARMHQAVALVILSRTPRLCWIRTYVKLVLGWANKQQLKPDELAG